MTHIGSKEHIREDILFLEDSEMLSSQGYIRTSPPTDFEQLGLGVGLK